MLTHLTLINFALAEHLAIDIDKGFNVLTGETGAGKSLLLDALSACLGERTDTNYVRYGTEKADVTATFSYQEDSPEASWLKEHELDDESGEIHLRRVIFATGRSKAWINGRPSSLSELKEIGRLLVQLYSQHSQQQLLEPPYPKHWLDRYSNFYAPLRKYVMLIAPGIKIFASIRPRWMHKQLVSNVWKLWSCNLKNWKKSSRRIIRKLSRNLTAFHIMKRSCRTVSIA
jgi:ATPase involved in DNA repair